MLCCNTKLSNFLRSSLKHNRIIHHTNSGSSKINPFDVWNFTRSYQTKLHDAVNGNSAIPIEQVQVTTRPIFTPSQVNDTQSDFNMVEEFDENLQNLKILMQIAKIDSLKIFCSKITSF